MEATEKKKLGGGAFILEDDLNKQIFTPEDFNE